MRAAWLLAVALLLAGCVGAPQPADDPPQDPLPPTDEPGNGGSPAPDGSDPPLLQGPTWRLGDAWTYRIALPDGERTHELVVFRDDGEHWWLGLADRALALEHALRDTNPLIGRIHHGILSPHESGRHAGMYAFPLEDGRAWTGDVFGRTWSLRGTWDAAAQRYTVEGTAGDGARIAYDYDPATRWFTSLLVTEGNDAAVGIALLEHDAGRSGTYHFFRGPEVYAGPAPPGPASMAAQVDEFRVEDPGDFLGLSLRGEATGPGAVVVLDPSGAERFNRTLTAAGPIDVLAELPAAAGTWKVTYAGLASLAVELNVAAIEAHVETV